MSYLPTPAPEPTQDDSTFWDWCRRGELRFQRCADCKVFRHPPVPACPRCHSFRCEWIEAPQTAELFSFTVVHHPVSETLRPHVPYNIAIVDFPGIEGIRLVSNIVGIAPENIRIGMALRLVWEVADNGIPLPRFAAR